MPAEPEVDLRGAQLLLVDDVPANLDVLCALLEAEGFDVALATDGPLALEVAANTSPDLILLDVMMPEMDGFEVCRRLKRDPKLESIPVVFVTARDQAEDVVGGFRAGGIDYIPKPFRDEEVLARVRTQLRLSFLRHELEQANLTLVQRNGELEAKNQALEKQVAARKQLQGQLSLLSEREAKRWGVDGFIGHSPTFRRILDDIRLMQENPATSVIITGESGTGKELVARAIHHGSNRGQRPFIPVNCASMPAELAESLLFGHEKGAFTGATTERGGFFEMAHEGTLFLDELGEMPLELQSKLLRVLEDGQVWRVGARTGRQVDVRVLAATNKDLEQQVQSGDFRQDLYYRLARFTVAVPPLRDRPEDIPLLAGHFIELFAAEMGREPADFTPAALQLLQDHHYPGNARELRNIVERGLIESRGAPVEPAHLHFLQTAASPSPGLATTSGPATLEENERRHVLAVLEENRWVVRSAARILGVPESTLRGRMKSLGIERPASS